jgi:8-oxo-dGTP pyrophosphatase MutT (NUDIX family)
MKEIRHKAIVIPRTSDGRFLTVRDSRHQEWIFVTGGCKKSEMNEPLRCGLRELEEETRGVFSIREGSYTTFAFESSYRSPEELKNDRAEGLVVSLVYHVFVIDVEVTPDRQRDIIKMFHINKEQMDINKRDGVRIKRAYDENDDISFDTLEEFNKKKRWRLIVSNVIENPKFQIALASHEKQPFFTQ